MFCPFMCVCAHTHLHIQKRGNYRCMVPVSDWIFEVHSLYLQLFIFTTFFNPQQIKSKTFSLLQLLRYVLIAFCFMLKLIISVCFVTDGVLYCLVFVGIQWVIMSNFHVFIRQCHFIYQSRIEEIIHLVMFLLCFIICLSHIFSPFFKYCFIPPELLH